MGLHQAGYEVVGVDIKPQPSYPFEFIQANALTADLSGFDFVWASPPCQKFTAYRRKGHGVGDGYLDLIPDTRKLLCVAKAWVIENVPGAPLRDPIRLCGSSFGLNIRRHRIFETSHVLTPPPCNHAWQKPRYPAATNRAPMSRCTVEIGVWRIPLSTQQAAMGIDWMGIQELSQAVPPAYSEWIATSVLRASEEGQA